MSQGADGLVHQCKETVEEGYREEWRKSFVFVAREVAICVLALEQQNSSQSTTLSLKLASETPRRLLYTAKSLFGWRSARANILGANCFVSPF
jgi:hypothetical protein